MEKGNMVYLVCILQGPLFYCAKRIQKFLWDKYNLGSDPLPELHMTMDALFYRDSNDLIRIQRCLAKIITDIEPFEIISNGFSYIPEPYNCITVHIVKTQQLKEIYKKIHYDIQNEGISVREFSPEEIFFHISLAGIHGRAWSTEESKKAWEEIRNFQIKQISTVNDLQLWFPDQHEPAQRVISKFNLRR